MTMAKAKARRFLEEYDNDMKLWAIQNNIHQSEDGYSATLTITTPLFIPHVLGLILL